MPTPIPPISQPEFGAWISGRRLSFREVGRIIGRGPQQVARYCLPFDDPRRQRPTDDVLEKIVALTGGEITAAHFYPPHLRGAASPADPRGGDPQVLRHARAH